MQSRVAQIFGWARSGHSVISPVRDEMKRMYSTKLVSIAQNSSLFLSDQNQIARQYVKCPENFALNQD